MLVASEFLDYRDDWHHSGLQSALSSADKHWLHSQVPTMARVCPRRPWKAAGEGIIF
ncbi:unnamed protein product [Staurois parvus]|uniref:Uncharacterized protein n=1 Tax=Staurois parvus TaxID=386267 RepID=A0ABN9F4F5_9NEOB|nr:unnamed protein product [Staurois parvus]